MHNATVRLAGWRRTVASMASLFVMGCVGEATSDTAPNVTIAATAAGANAGVLVSGVGERALERLRGVVPDDSIWVALVGVYVQPGGDTAAVTDAAAGTPPVIGRYQVDGDAIRFTPRFPFAPGVSYVVRVDTARLARYEAARRATVAATVAPLEHRFSRPAVVRARTTRVVAIHPSASRVPSNLLRWYIDFSAPMETGVALSHVRLLDEAGREVPRAFLTLEQELWDPERRRLTLLFDPGRVKRGVRTNEESGAPLIAGRRYRLVIDNDWPDGAGAALASGFAHAFEATPADRRPVDPARWRLTIPTSGTEAPVAVAFGEPLDHALASRMITVFDASGRPVAGAATLSDDDAAWRFAPERAWQAGEYTLRVATALEDVAGNNVSRALDVDRRAPNAQTPAPLDDSIRVVRFRVASVSDP